MKTIGVYTSGGDAPGMNAAIRAVVRTAIFRQLEVVGIYQGYTGMLRGEFHELDLRSMANVIQRGGTILKTGRCPEFLQKDKRAQAATNVQEAGIEGLICIGGNGSLEGAHLLYKEHGIPVVGVPGTIDNDIYGTDQTIGFDTAVNTALEAIDRIRDTAASHDRLFIVEVMGRDSGFIALEVGLAGGAEDVFIPENPVSVDEVVTQIKGAVAKGKSSSILVAAEGQKPGRAYDLAEAIRKKSGFEAKVCILGHIQRGGTPTASDRNLASRLGTYALNALLEGQTDVMVGVQSGRFGTVPLVDCFTKKKSVDKSLIELVQILST